MCWNNPLNSSNCFVTVTYKSWSEASSQQEFTFQWYEEGPSLGAVGGVSLSFAAFLSAGLSSSSLTVSGGRPSFFWHFFSSGLSAQVGFVRPIAAAFAFHGSGAPYLIGIPSKIHQ